MQINNIKNKLNYGYSLLHRYKYTFNINNLVMLYFSFFIDILIIVLLYGEVLTVAI